MSQPVIRYARPYPAHWGKLHYATRKALRG
jgi:hypothetical protein